MEDNCVNHCEGTIFLNLNFVSCWHCTANVSNPVSHLTRYYYLMFSDELGVHDTCVG